MSRVGKREKDVALGRERRSCRAKAVEHKNKAILDFILASARDDERPYLEVEIFGKKILGLLDSGASATILGGPGWELFKSSNLSFSGNITSCVMANGQSSEVLGSIRLPIRVRDQVIVFDVLVIPEVTHAIVLGADFWKRMGIVPDLRTGEWIFSSNPTNFISAIESRTELSKDQELELDNVVQEEFGKLFSDKLGCARHVEHVITTESPPIKQRCRPLSPPLQKQVDEALTKMLKDDVIEKSNSAWSSPILLVPRKDGTYRFCVDFRKLNSVTKRDSYPLPNVTNILDRLRDAKFLSSLDMKSAYWQIKLSEESKQYTAFSVLGRGLYQFKRLPFGLHNAPATFQRFIDQVLGPELEPYVFVYLDDIIIITQTFEQHLKVMREVLSRLWKAGLILNRDKCQFCRPELRYLGYVVDKNGLRVDPEKVQAILKIPTPTTVSEVRRVMGMASWYRRFVPQFSSIIAPLSNLLRKNRPFVWTKDCEDAWGNIKDRLVTSPILTCPDFSQRFFVQTDASNYGLGAVLTQRHEDGEKVISYLSRSLTKAERNYSTTEKELLAVIFAIEKLRPYLEGSHFTVITDHYSLLWLHSLDNPSGRLARWAVRLQQYSFDIIHRKGKEHVVPDALSRAVVTTDSEQLATLEANKENIQDKWYTKLLQSVGDNPSKYPAFRIEGNRLYKFEEHEYPELADDECNWKEVVPKERRRELIRQNHDEPTSGHLGIFKTYHRLKQRYTWPKMKYDVSRYVRRCTTCIQSKPEQKAVPGRMGGHSKISRPWEMLCIDLIGPLPRSTSGNNFILIIADCFSKFVLSFPLRKATAARVVKHLEEDVFLIYGVPRGIISDNGVQFRSKEYKQLLERYKVRPLFTAFYHPQANPAERVNRVVKTMLISYVSKNHRVWDRLLPKITCAIRTSKHETTGLTPYFINFGREIYLEGNPSDTETKVPDDPNIKMDRDQNLLGNRAVGFKELFTDVRRRLNHSYLRSKERYDLRHRQVQFYPNQLVWRKNFVLSDASKYYAAKLAEKYKGPFMIHKRVATDMYELKDLNGKILSGCWANKYLKSHPSDVEEEENPP